MDKVEFSQGIETALNAGNLLNPANINRAKTETRKTRAKRDPGESQRSEFSEVLDRSVLDMTELGPLREIPPSEEAIQELLDTVQSTGNELKHRPFPEEILRYKQAVRNFLHYVVENGFTVEQTQTARRKRKEIGPYIQIRVIDQKLEELAAGILTKQISELALKSKLEEISGLLVNLVVTGKINERL